MKLMNIIYTNDMQRAVAFYETLGLTRTNRNAIDGWWNELVIGDATIALHWNEGDPIPAPSPHLELHFRVPGVDLERLYAEFEHKGLALGGPIQMLEGVGRYFLLTDPDGLKVQFNEAEDES